MKRQAAAKAGAAPTQAIDVTGQAAGSAEPGYSSAEDTLGGAELLEDRTVRISGGGHGRRVGMSGFGAVAGSLLVVALAFGAAMGPLDGSPTGAGHEGTESTFDVDDTDAKTGSTDDGKPDGDPGGSTDDGKPDGEPDGDEEKPDTGTPDKTASPDHTEKPAATETPDAPDAKVLAIGLAIEGTSVVVEWSACETDGFLYYKVIRSKDAFATWPLGAGDSLAAAIGDPGTTRFVDKAVDGGHTYHYKVVALREWEGTKVVACRTDTASIETPAPTPKPQPTDDGGDGTMSIALAIKEGHVLIDWSACKVDFDYYKVVRSLDTTITWPPSGDDSKVAAVHAGGETAAWDGNAPGGKKVYYRVFCIRETESGSVAVAATAVKGIETPPAEPAPEPVVLGFDLELTGEGVVLNWETCSSDKFMYYKVVRSTMTKNPSYLPYTEGSEVIAVIEDAGNSAFVDEHISSGKTIYYRIQAIGYWNGQKVVLGQTPIKSVTIP